MTAVLHNLFGDSRAEFTFRLTIRGALGDKMKRIQMNYYVAILNAVNALMLLEKSSVVYLLIPAIPKVSLTRSSPSVRLICDTAS